MKKFFTKDKQNLILYVLALLLIVFICMISASSNVAMAATQNVRTDLTVENYDCEFVSVACGVRHTVAIDNNGNLYSWGNNEYGQLGLNTTVSSLTPQHIKMSGINFIEIACGEDFSLALSDNGKLYSWGHNNCGQLGDGTFIDKHLPTEITYTEPFIKICCGTDHSMAISESGKLYVWGSNSSEKLGIEEISDYNKPQLLKIDMTVKEIACGTSHSMAITMDGDIYAWGDNSYGQLGDSNIASLSTYIPQKINLIGKKFSKISCGNYHSLALSDSGEVYAWGKNDLGQIGNGSTENGILENVSTPFQIDIINVDFNLITCGSSNSFAVSANGDLYAWGKNDIGKSGDCTLSNNLTPKQITAVVEISYIAAGANYTVVIDSNNNLYTWGNNADGKLGNGNTVNSLLPLLIKVEMDGMFNKIACGNNHSMALSDAGYLYTWGANNYGQLGNGYIVDALEPQRIIVQDVIFKEIACGNGHSLALSSTGELYTWGHNNYGQLGDGTSDDCYTPKHIAVSGVTFSQIACGYDHSLAISSNGELYSWGYNSCGQIGNNSIIDVNIPKHILISENIIKIACGSCHSCAITADNRLYTWGNNSDGQIDDNSYTNALVPKNIYLSGTKCAEIACGKNYTLALTNNNNYYAWGNNDYGQLGDKTTTCCKEPKNIVMYGGVKFIKIACGETNSIAISTDNNLYVWGNNKESQLGNGNTYNANCPQNTTLKGIAISKIASGASHALAVSNTGKLYSWGNNDNGQLGDCTTQESNLPQQIILSGEKFNKIAIGETHTIALSDEGELYAWGNNSNGQLGLNSNLSYDIPQYIDVPNVKFSEVACGTDFSIALSNVGDLYVWGKNDKRQLGDNSTVDVNAPKKLEFENVKFSKIACGDSHITALSTTGEIYSWGDNTSGQVGVGTTETINLPQKLLVNGVTFIDIACRMQHSMAISSTGTIYAWGNNASGQIGDGNVANVLEPTPIIVNDI